MGCTLKLTRYTSKDATSTELVTHIPSRVTITGKEDHFSRAYEDVQMFLAGMRELDRLLGHDKNAKGEECPVHYYVKSLEAF